jgi:hypothetical protein
LVGIANIHPRTKEKGKKVLRSEDRYASSQYTRKRSKEKRGSIVGKKQEEKRKTRVEQRKEKRVVTPFPKQSKFLFHLDGLGKT